MGFKVRSITKKLFERTRRALEKFFDAGLGLERRLLCAANSTETLLELVDATFGINEGRLTSVEWVSVCSNAHGDNEVIYAINIFNVVGFLSGAREVALTRSHVLEDYWVVIWMNISFHSIDMVVPRFRRGGVRRMQGLHTLSTN
mgnify:CR=1 FL=1